MDLKYLEYLEYPDIPLRNIPRHINNLFSTDNCAVAVNYIIYDKKRKTIINFGSSRPCGCNYHKASIHAEQIAINFCRSHSKNNLQIFIWRWDKSGKIKPTYCCISCSKLVKKYGYEDNIFTINNKLKVKAIINDPKLSLAYKIKYNLKD